MLICLRRVKSALTDDLFQRGSTLTANKHQSSDTDLLQETQRNLISD